jgi:hypothetical protein
LQSAASAPTRAVRKSAFNASRARKQIGCFPLTMFEVPSA